MAFIIKNISGTSIDRIVQRILKIKEKSRFSFDLVRLPKAIKFENIRLNDSKHYCGNHPLPCPIRPFQSPRPHKKSKCLEGADWVAFNDMLNDVLDKLNVSANASSSVLIIRKGFSRCMEYTSHILGNGIDNEWDKDSGQFEFCIGLKAPRSIYPNGTPGIPEYLTSKARKYKIVDHDEH